jgi:hypothetical protein
MRKTGFHFFAQRSSAPIFIRAHYGNEKHGATIQWVLRYLLFLLGGAFVLFGFFINIIVRIK